jgi:acyl-CoA thioesterase
VSRHGEEILTAHGALGARSFEFEGVWAVRPEVAAPDSCEPYRFFARGQGNMGDFAEFRLAHGQQLDDVVALGGRGDGRLALWIRCWSGEHAVTVSDLAFIGDFMPMAFAQAIRGPYAGNSLDNTIRVGQLTTTGWVLMAAQVQQIANGFGYGRAELWADDGTMLGEVSQSVVLRKHGHLRMPPDQRG